MPIHTYTNWNTRPSDQEEQIEPFRKYFFICEGVNTETFYFRRLIDLRKQLGIHPLIDIRLWEKTDKDRDISYAKRLIGKNAFYGDKGLKSIKIQSLKLTTVGANAFKGINAKATIKVPKKKLKTYTKLLSKKGLPKTVKIK